MASKTERVALERCLALTVETGALAAAAGPKLGMKRLRSPSQPQVELTASGATVHRSR